jgi:RimJ/RimL family protein N-acetyltransferase
LNTSTYKILKQYEFVFGAYRIIPIRDEDKLNIMRWRNEQMYHLRQHKLLDEAQQTAYFTQVVAKLFNQEQPDQLLFSYMEGDRCIGYGGLVHINWVDRNAEISFVMETALERDQFEIHWVNFLTCIEQVAFHELGLHKIFTYAFDLRPRLYIALSHSGFYEESRLKEHCRFNGTFIDVLVHSKFGYSLRPASMADTSLTFSYATDEAIRRNSFSGGKITHEGHVKWFQTKLSDSNCYYLIFEKNKKPIGSIRLDIKSEGVAMISYLIDSAFHGMGYGKWMLSGCMEYIKNHQLPITQLTGEVLKTNIASVKVFEKHNFRICKEDEQSLTFTKEINV